MQPSYHIIPQTATKVASVRDTANSSGLHDALQYGPRRLDAELNAQHPLEHRLKNWESTQDNLKLTLLRDVYGLHAPVRLLMERTAVSRNLHMPALPRSNIHLDILMGRDELIQPADIFEAFGEDKEPSLSIHLDMERMLRM